MLGQLPITPGSVFDKVGIMIKYGKPIFVYLYICIFAVN